jgi:hypothetical protein
MTTTPTLTRFRIDSTDIFLDDYGAGKGKITVSDTYEGSFSHFWDAMGCSLSDFLLHIDGGYFSSKLNPYCSGVFDPKRSVTNIRKLLREDYYYQLPWYENMEAMKELRDGIKRLEFTNSAEHFILRVERLVDELTLPGIDSSYERNEFLKGVTDLLSDPWYFIELKPSNQTLFLQKLLPKLKKEIKKHKKGLVKT